VLLNLTVDEDGVISIPRDQLGAHQHLHLVAVDPRSTVYRAVSLPETDIATNDLRLIRGLDPEKHFAQKKLITAVSGEKPFAIADITSSRFELYDSLSKVYTLYTTLSGDAKLAEFGFVTRWPQLPVEEKRAKYSEFACHELNLFLYHKDPEFFRAVAAPLLQNKKDKQFLDLWLLGSDLNEFLQPWNYQRLNVAERILLAQRIAADRQFTTRHVQDLYALLPPDIERFNFLFETAVQGSALETGDMLGLKEAKKQAEADRGAAPGMAGLEQLRRAQRRPPPLRRVPRRSLPRRPRNRRPTRRWPAKRLRT
jgi:hypothetical protein